MAYLGGLRAIATVVIAVTCCVLGGSSSTALGGEIHDAVASRDLGCVDALNFDGGASIAMYYRGRMITIQINGKSGGSYNLLVNRN